MKLRTKIALFLAGSFLSISSASAAISTLTLTSPVGGESLSGTSTITWTSDGTASDTVEIYYCKGAGCDSNLYTSLSSGQSDMGTFSFNSASLLDGADYKIKIAATADPTIASTSTAFFTIDNTVPILQGGSIVGTTIQGAGDSITFTFSEPVSPADGTWSANEFESINSPTTTPFSLTNATFAPHSGTTTSLTITLNESTDNSFLRNGNTILIKPAASAIKDIAGNYVANVAVVGTTTITGDVTPPSSWGSTITSNNSHSSSLAKPGDIITVAFTASERITSPTIMIAGHAASVSYTGGNDWIGTTSMQVADSEGDIPFSINYSDLAGNAGYPIITTTNSSHITFDKTPPSATITFSTTTTLAIGATATTTFTFSEPVIGFDNSDVTAISNGTLATVVTADGGTTWTAVFTPSTDSSSATNTITLNTAGLTDLAGNAGTSTSVSPNYLVDTLRPTLTISLSNTALSAGQTSLVTFLFSEPVVGFDNSDITRADNGTLTAATSTDGGTVWTSTFTPTGNTNVGTNVITVNLSGITDRVGNAGTSTVSSPNYTINTIIVATGGGGGGGSWYAPSTNSMTNTISSTNTSLSSSNQMATSSTSTLVQTTASTRGQVLGVSTFYFLNNLHIGSQGDDVKELQKILIAGGFLKTTNFGYFGIVTKAALAAWQSKNNLPANGYFGPMTRSAFNAINSASRISAMKNASSTNSIPQKSILGAFAVNFQNNLHVGSQGSDVEALQNILIKQGYLASPVTGYFGKLTKEALAKWQLKNNLPANGYFGPMSRNILNSSLLE